MRFRSFSRKRNINTLVTVTGKNESKDFSGDKGKCNWSVVAAVCLEAFILVNRRQSYHN